MPRLLPLIALVLLAGCGQKGPLYLPAGPAAGAPAAAIPGAGSAPAVPTPDTESRERATPAQP